jgi:hypothetical protein
MGSVLTICQINPEICSFSRQFAGIMQLMCSAQKRAEDALGQI